MQSPPPPPNDLPPPPPPAYNAPTPYYQQPPKARTPIWVWVIVGCFGFAVVGIGVMAAILFPIFAQARESAKQTTCLSKMKQMGLGVMMYLQDHDERYPIATNWMDTTYPYLKNEWIYNCPTLNPAPQNSSRSSRNVVYSYGYNSELSKLKFAKILEPGRTVMLFESDKKTKSAADPLQSVANPPRHNKRNNFGYADGHAKSHQEAEALNGGHSLTLDKTVKD